MAAAIQYDQEEIELFDYALNDFLELKGALSAIKAGALKRFLLSQRLDGLCLVPVEGFALAGNLVVIEQRKTRGVKTLVFLSPKDGRIRIRQLR